MPVILLSGCLAIALWSLVAHRFERNGIAGPAVLALVGALVVLVDTSAFTEAIDSAVALRAVELILAILLFVDACEVRGGVFGGEGRALARLLFIALPLSLVLVVLFGAWALPDLDVFVLIVVGCIIMPIDFAPAASLRRTERIPARVRRIMGVESGYNDGLLSPVFGMSLAAALALPKLIDAVSSDGGLSGRAEAALERDLEELLTALFGAIPAAATAILLGAAIGGLLGLLIRRATARGWADASGIRFVMLLIPLLAYGVATLDAVGANGFVTAFVAGVVCRVSRTRGAQHDAIPRAELQLVEEAGTLVGHFVWFVLGATAMSVVLSGVDWRVLALALLALTVFRAVPVALAMLGSGLPVRSVALMGFGGPRGTATIVFGLIAFNRLPDPASSIVLEVAVLTVLSSILLHGVAAPLLLRRVPGRRG